MRKASRRSDCENCLVEYRHCVRNSRGGVYNHAAYAQFVKLKTYDWAKHGLLVPLPALFSLCCTLERIVSFSVEQLCCSSNVAQNLRQCIYTSVDLYSFDIDCACTSVSTIVSWNSLHKQTRWKEIERPKKLATVRVLSVIFVLFCILHTMPI